MKHARIFLGEEGALRLVTSLPPIVNLANLATVLGPSATAAHLHSREFEVGPVSFVRGGWGSSGGGKGSKVRICRVCAGGLLSPLPALSVPAVTRPLPPCHTIFYKPPSQVSQEAFG